MQWIDSDVKANKIALKRGINGEKEGLESGVRLEITCFQNISGFQRSPCRLDMIIGSGGRI